MFGVAWNTAGSMAPGRLPADALPCPVNAPGRTAETTEDVGSEDPTYDPTCDPTYAARAPEGCGRQLTVRAAGGASG
jgi:hypothetical protein